MSQPADAPVIATTSLMFASVDVLDGLRAGWKASVGVVFGG
jgi:hypothetical protein